MPTEAFRVDLGGGGRAGGAALGSFGTLGISGAVWLL